VAAVLVVDGPDARSVTEVDLAQELRGVVRGGLLADA
jgi:hypothetical protein